MSTNAIAVGKIIRIVNLYVFRVKKTTGDEAVEDLVDGRVAQARAV